jgi:ATP-dependent RNA helicase DDX55/SPB4
MWALHGKMKQGAREATLSSFATATHGVLLATDVAARGLDIPDVHWIVQADPPQDPAAFVHRVGRTARMGKSGRALALLLPHEEAYVEFLRLRKVPLIREDEGKGRGNGTTDTTNNDNGKGEDGFELRKYTEKERELMEAGLKAFISYIRAYKEHHCSYIFRIQDLDIAALARSFGLLRLPRMPEIKKAHHQGVGGNGVESVGFVASLIDPDTVPYKDKNRERQRVSGLAKKKAEREASIAASAVKKQAHQKAAAAPRLTAAKRRQLENRQELGEMNDDYALLKKLKKGKISEREFDVAAGLTDDDDDGGSGGEDGDEEEGGSDGDRDEKKREASSLVAMAVMKKAKRKRRRNAKNNN